MSETFKKSQMSEFFDVSAGCILVIHMLPSYRVTMEACDFHNWDVIEFTSGFTGRKTIPVSICTHLWAIRLQIREKWDLTLKLM